MREFTIDLHDGRGNQVYVLKIDQLAALKAYKQNNYDPAESIRLNVEVMRLTVENQRLLQKVGALELALSAINHDRYRPAIIEKIINFALKTEGGGYE